MEYEEELRKLLGQTCAIRCTTGLGGGDGKAL